MAMLNERLVVIGAGYAGTEFAFAARAFDWTGPITVIGDDPALPYHRPPLSKTYLMGEVGTDSLALKAHSLYETKDITLLQGMRAVEIDRTRSRVRLFDDSEVPYDRLVLATGGRPRPLPSADSGAGDTENFHYLRTLDDSDAIRRNFAPGKRLVVIGGGYIGLEVAAVAIKLGMPVTLLEAAPRLLARVTAPELSAFYEGVHRKAGVDVRTDQQVSGFELSKDKQRVQAVCCADGTRVPAEVVVVGVGLLPNSELASAAGLTVENGISIDSRMLTIDDRIFAIGDCAYFHSELYDRRVRIESVPNSLEQARKAAAILCQKEPRNDVAPWFWSDQYDLSLKMVGLSDGYDRFVLRGSMEEHSFAAFYMTGNRVLAVDTVNRPMEFNLSKRLIAERLPIEPELLADDALPFKEILKQVHDRQQRQPAAQN